MQKQNKPYRTMGMITSHDVYETMQRKRVQLKIKMRKMHFHFTSDVTAATPLAKLVIANVIT